MRATAYVLTLFVLSGPALADEKCRSELAAAFDKQNATSKFRSTVTSPIQGGMTGTAERTIDLVRPDKVYSRVKSSAEEGLAETIVIGQHAWSNSGMGWDEIQPNIAKVMSLDVAKMNEPQKVSADFNCLGKTAFQGKDYIGYRGAPGKAEDGTDLETTVYVDEASGLPAFNIVAPAADAGKPLLTVAYSYGDDISVEAPMEPKQSMTDKPAADAPPAANKQ